MGCLDTLDFDLVEFWAMGWRKELQMKSISWSFEEAASFITHLACVGWNDVKLVVSSF